MPYNQEIENIWSKDILMEFHYLPNLVLESVFFFIE